VAGAENWIGVHGGQSVDRIIAGGGEFRRQSIGAAFDPLKERHRAV
jgi:hypothetical protein